MVPLQFYYPWVVIEFYHTMTSRQEANPTALHFSINGRLGILRASNITVALHLPVVLANAAGYRQWSHPSTRVVSLSGQLVLEVRFILLILVLLVPHARQSPFLYT